MDIVLYNEIGTVVFSKTINAQVNQQYTIPVDTLASGFYILSLKDKNGYNFSRKLNIK